MLMEWNHVQIQVDLVQVDQLQTSIGDVGLCWKDPRVNVNVHWPQTTDGMLPVKWFVTARQSTGRDRKDVDTVVGVLLYLANKFASALVAILSLKLFKFRFHPQKPKRKQQQVESNLT